MILIKCDRCGKAVEKKAWIEMPIMEITVMPDTKNAAKRIDLCDDCKDKFWGWLEGREE